MCGGGVLQMMCQTLVCMVHAIFRTITTIAIMLENLIRMLLQTVYNLVSLVLQLLSLIPICCVFIVTSRLQCLLCSGAGCPIGRNSRCGCLMTLLAIIAIYYILRATGELDRIMKYFGYTKENTKKFVSFRSSKDLDWNATTELPANMCRTVHALLQTVICGIQMLVRVFMTIILMIENLIRMILQTLYNFISFMLQMLSLIPICLVFLLTARMKCFMCGGGGACPVARGGVCDCLMSLVAIIILFFIFRATGVLDKIFFSLGYAKYRPPPAMRFVPTQGQISECSRNETEGRGDQQEYEVDTTAEPGGTTPTEEKLYYDSDEDRTTEPYYWYTWSMQALTTATRNKSYTGPTLPGSFPWRWPVKPDTMPHRRFLSPKPPKKKKKPSTTKKWTTVVYYLV